MLPVQMWNESVDGFGVNGFEPEFGNGGRMDLKAVSTPTPSVTRRKGNRLGSARDFGSKRRCSLSKSTSGLVTRRMDYW